MSNKDFKPYKPLKERLVDLPDPVQQIVLKLPQEDQDNAAQILLAEFTEVYVESFTGPLPPPSVLEEYNRIVPGSAKTFIDSLQNQTASRINNESLITKSNISIAKTGQIMAFILAFVVLGLSGYFQFLGFTTYAVTLASTTILGLVVAFITGKYYRVKDLKQENFQQ